WTATDNVGVDYVALYLYAGGAAVNTSAYGGTSDGALGAAALHLAGNANSYSWTIPAALPVRSDYSVKVVAFDAAGNSGNRFTNTFTVQAPASDTVSPV